MSSMYVPTVISESAMPGNIKFSMFVVTIKCNYLDCSASFSRALAVWPVFSLVPISKRFCSPFNFFNLLDNLHLVKKTGIPI